MNLLTDQSVKPVVGAAPDVEEAPPWEEPKSEPEKPEKPILPEYVQLLVRLEGTSCIRLDSLGGGKIQLAFSDAQTQEAFQLGKYRGKNLIATFMVASGAIDKTK
ncbi:MAG: hypothetical protein Q7U76_12800 [Nitrospirota bacterium]|nr:hypothetical protein [Nitrospirota bacterium]